MYKLYAINKMDACIGVIIKMGAIMLMGLAIRVIKIIKIMRALASPCLRIPHLWLVIIHIV
jgi:hypothetical protein